MSHTTTTLALIDEIHLHRARPWADCEQPMDYRRDSHGLL